MATITTSIDAILQTSSGSAGTVVQTHQRHRTIKTIRFAWTSTAGGAAEDQTDVLVSGRILRVCFIPGAGASQPTDNYDITIEDSDGIDALQGLGANLGNINATDVFPALTNGTNGNSTPVVVDSKLTLVVINAGNANSGETVIYYE